MTGMYASIAVLAALNHRERTGEGQYIDMALLDVQVAMLANMNMNFLTTGQSPKRWGNAHANIVPYQTFATATAIIVAAGNDSQYRKFVTIGGKPELADDERFATNPAQCSSSRHSGTGTGRHGQNKPNRNGSLHWKKPVSLWPDQSVT
jgi:formyl-CoA transferase